MAKLTLGTVGSLQSEQTALQSINNNFASIAAALELFLSRDGKTPNYMSASLDMNSNRIINLPAPSTASEPVRLADIGGIVPADIANAGAYAAQAQASATAAAVSATAAATYVGAATSAPKWSTARTISLFGDLTGVSPSWDGSSNLTFSGITINTGAVDSTKLALGAAVGNIGYTPVNKAGDTLTGNLRLNFTASTLTPDSVGFRGVPIVTYDTTHTFSVDDCGRMSRHTSGSAHTWWIDDSGVTPYPIGTTIAVRNVGAGVVTIGRGAGVSLRKVGTSTDANVSLAQWGMATLVHEAANVWLITGVGIT
jgi:hypothetical protein